MGATNIVDRLAAVDHELRRAEAMRALAQTNGDDTEGSGSSRKLTKFAE
jgi:hypothetical protein